jgi:alkylhydroperoxidase family enzyme
MLRHMMMCCLLFLPAILPFNARADSPPRMPVLTNAEAWKRLPGAPAGEQKLPGWARMLAGPMPLTTARMLELDAMHRTGDRLDAQLRCLVRWAAADANGCAYSRAVAEADLRRARNADADLADLVNHPDKLPALDRAAVAFARRMMREAHEVSDAEVKQLLELAGEERLVALVTLLAHASFQDRIIMALNTPANRAGDIPPFSGAFARPAKKATEGPKGPPPLPTVVRGASVGPEWLKLQQCLDKQRERVGRIRVPTQDEVINRIGKEHPSAWQAGIRWSRVCYGFQPELTEAWFDCAAAFRQEGGLNPVFSNSIFWVVTQSAKCHY